MKIQEVATTPKKPLTPEQSRIEALKAQAKRSQEAVKAERARQKMQSAQKALANARNVSNEHYQDQGFVLISEAQQLSTFQAQVKVTAGKKTVMAVTEIRALNMSQAKAMLQRMYGDHNVHSLRLS